MKDKRQLVPVEPMQVDKPTDADELAHLAVQVDDGRLIKMEVDYTKLVDEALPKASNLAKVSFESCICLWFLILMIFRLVMSMLQSKVSHHLKSNLVLGVI